ncbi:MAG: glycosyltransferase family 39 protein, partial [Myxococcota bacterium]
MRPLVWGDHLIGLVLAVATVVVLLATMDLGFTRDEGYYFKAAELYVGWFKELAAHLKAGTDWRTSFGQASIDRHWSYNGEHPALPKALFGLSAWVFHEWLGWLSVSTAMRLPAALCAGLLSYLIYLFGAERWGRPQGIFAAAAMVLLPRPFFHAHLACFDYPMTAMWFLVLYGYWRSLRSTLWGWATGLFFGLALSTKLNAFFLPPVVVLHWMWVYGPRTRLLQTEDGWRIQLPPVPVALLSMAFLGPVVWYMLWPRHWFDTFNRVSWFMSFHLNHVHYFQSYFGQNLYAPPFPVAFPVTLSVVTLPEVTMLAWLCGMVLLVGRWLRSDGGWSIMEWVRTPIRARLGAVTADPLGSGWWLLLGGVVPIAII